MIKSLALPGLALLQAVLPAALVAEARGDASAPALTEAVDGVIPSEGAQPRLGGRIQDGTVTLNDIPLVIIYLIDLLTKIAGTIAVIYLLIGGFRLMLSELLEEREGAKNTIKNALLGLTITFMAWVIVNLVQVQLTVA